MSYPARAEGLLIVSRKLSRLDELDMQDTAGEVITNSCEPLHMDEQKQDDQLEPLCNSCVPMQDIDSKTSLKRWTIETGGERESGKSVLAAWHDDNDNEDWNTWNHLTLWKQTIDIK